MRGCVCPHLPLPQSWLTFAAWAVALGGPQLLLYVDKVRGHSRFTRLQGVWVDQGEPGPHTLWLEALGVFVPLNLLGLWYHRGTLAAKQFQLGLLAVFLVGNVVVFQPWEVSTGAPCACVARARGGVLACLRLRGGGGGVRPVPVFSGGDRQRRTWGKRTPLVSRGEPDGSASH